MSEEFMKSVGSYLPMIVIVVAMILIMIIPQRKRDKKMREMLEGVKAGDNIKNHRRHLRQSCFGQGRFGYD